jgi:predicted transcriptional regulator
MPLLLACPFQLETGSVFAKFSAAALANRDSLRHLRYLENIRHSCHEELMQDLEFEMKETLITLTSDIVAAHVSNNDVAVTDVPALITNVYAALAALGEAAPVVENKPEPAVSIRASVKPDYIVCLEDGKKLKMLKRYLRTNYNMTPEEYRARWGLPADYPMVAPNYAETRRDLAKKIGLGRKPGTTVRPRRTKKQG